MGWRRRGRRRKGGGGVWMMMMMMTKGGFGRVWMNVVFPIRREGRKGGEEELLLRLAVVVVVVVVILFTGPRMVKGVAAELVRPGLGPRSRIGRRKGEIPLLLPGNTRARYRPESRPTGYSRA
ncbi:hypothetical protein F4778DRAFT_728973 [Xylariomycetidae sp. FL2044]|nr:hypothetical protein F4778DRAFT_728973 [Xylariomycetidae sp. FL2044]